MAAGSQPCWGPGRSGGRWVAPRADIGHPSGGVIRAGRLAAVEGEQHEERSAMSITSPRPPKRAALGAPDPAVGRPGDPKAAHPAVLRPPEHAARRPAPGAQSEFDFPAVPLLEHRPYDRIRELYLYEEPALLAAIQRGDRGEAIRIINYVLVHIYSAGQERSDLLKGLLLELVVMMSRAAVEAGSPQSEVLGHNFRCLTELAEISDDEQLAQWLRAMFERIFAAIERQEDFTPPLLVTRALAYLRENLHRDVTRDETAQYAGISPSHFSRLIRERTGRSFTELLRQARVELAAELLVMTDDPLVVIAGRCGFCDQSYFTRVFQQVRQMTPRQFREANRGSSSRPLPIAGEWPAAEGTGHPTPAAWPAAGATTPGSRATTGDGAIEFRTAEGTRRLGVGSAPRQQGFTRDY